MGLLLAGIAGAVACSGGAPVAQPAELTPVSTPTLTWADVERIGVYCVLASEQGVPQALQTRLCQALRDLVAQDASVPVEVIAIGDPALLRPGTVSIVLQGSVHASASIAPGARGQFLAFTMRPFRMSGDATTITGSTVQVAPLSAEAENGPAMTAALQAALNEILPWRSALTHRPRPLSN